MAEVRKCYRAECGMFLPHWHPDGKQCEDPGPHSHAPGSMSEEPPRIPGAPGGTTTLTTEEVREGYAQGLEEWRVAFDAWLEGVKAEARGEVVSALQQVFDNALHRAW